MAEFASKVINTGKSVANLWHTIGGIITDVEKTEKIDGDTALRLKAPVDVQLAALERNADEARAD